MKKLVCLLLGHKWETKKDEYSLCHRKCLRCGKKQKEEWDSWSGTFWVKDGK